MKKSTKIGLGIAGALAVLVYLIRNGKLSLPALTALPSTSPASPPPTIYGAPVRRV